MVNTYTTEIVTPGGMTTLKVLPDQEKNELRNKYFDEFTTYAPFKWLGSRRLTAEEYARTPESQEGLT